MSQPIKYWAARAGGITANKSDAINDISDNSALVAYSDYAALVQQGIRDHADWRSKLNFLEADYKAEIARLTAENERLKASQLSLEKWIACEQAHFETADNLREKLYQASVQIERLRKAGDAMHRAIKVSDYALDWAIEVWLAAKEGRDAK